MEKAAAGEEEERGSLTSHLPHADVEKKIQTKLPWLCWWAMLWQVPCGASPLPQPHASAGAGCSLLVCHATVRQHQSGVGRSLALGVESTWGGSWG